MLWAVRRHCRYGVSCRDLERMMGERSVLVDHSTICRWVQKYAPEMERRLRWQWHQLSLTSWRVDKTYIKVRGQWTYLYRSVDKFGNTIDFCLSPTRNTAAAKRFLGKALNGFKPWELPHVVNTDKAPTYAAALADDLAGPVSAALGLMRDVLQADTFDPAAAHHTVTVAMADYAAFVLLPPLLARLAVEAPRFDVRVRGIFGRAETLDLLDNGEASLAIGFPVEASARILVHPLLHEGFACIARRAHPAFAEGALPFRIRFLRAVSH